LVVARDHGYGVVLATDQIAERARGVGVEAGAVVPAVAPGRDRVQLGAERRVPGDHSNVGLTVHHGGGVGGHARR